LKAILVLQNFPAFKRSLQLEDSENALTLEYARKWKNKAARMARERKEKGEEDLLEKEKDEKDEEEEEGDHGSFGKQLGFAIAKLIIGTAVVAFFSDPMVDVINTFGNAIHVNAFYVSFLITPFCSNASELISSLAFASKKRQANTSLTYGQIYGAATMNNTMGLGIFYALVAFRGLAWTFSAETMAILFVTLAVGIPGALKRSFNAWWIIPNLALYPFSLLLVAFLENVFNWT